MQQQEARERLEEAKAAREELMALKAKEAEERAELVALKAKEAEEMDVAASTVAAISSASVAYKAALEAEHFLAEHE